MIIIVGLGNPGKEYINTRHNAGWLVLDKIVQSAKRSGQEAQNHNFKFKTNKKINAEIGEFEHGGDKIFLVKPQTFMNDSGLAVTRMVKWLNGQMVELSNDLWVVHDDLDLNLGEIRIVQDRGAAGHHGIESIIDHLKTQDFVRFRIGIRTTPKEQCLVSGKDYVLGEFKGEEREIFQKATIKCSEMIVFALENGLTNAMNKYN